jgi:hypothetical protein
LQHIATMRELQAGEPQSSEWVEIAKAGLGALGEYMAAKASMPTPPPRQLPAPPQRPPQAAPPPAPAAAPGAEAAPAVEGEVTEPESEERKQQAEWLKTAPPEEIIRLTVEAIQKETDPVDLAENFIDALQLNEALRAVVMQKGGYLQLFRERLGDAWLMAHGPYVRTLVSTMAQSAQKREKGAA